MLPYERSDVTLVFKLSGRAVETLLARLGPSVIGAPPRAVIESPNLAPELRAVPLWVLPLMRLLRGAAAGDLGRAWRELPHHVPAGTILPDPGEAAWILVELGLSERLGQ